MPEPLESRIARLLGDRYELIEPLGKGGFAQVYRVRNRRLQRTEALKVLSESLTEDADFARRFEQEARVVAALDHPNIVKVYDYGASEELFWFSMQFIGGSSLGGRIQGRGRLDDVTAARIAAGVLDALAYSHALGVIHRDIKPDNILLDREGRPYLTDFGVAKSQINLVKTQAGMLLGSPTYMSPEQLQGRGLDGRSDLYSLGVTLYRVLSGALPFSGGDVFRAAMKRLSEDPEPLNAREPSVHPVLARIVMRALERDPAKRFPDAVSMRREVEGFLADARVPAEEDETPTAPGLRIPSRATPAGEAPPVSPSGLKEGQTPAASAPAAAPAGRSFPFGWLALAGAVACVVAAGYFVLRLNLPSTPPAPALRTPAPSPAAAGPATGALPAPSFSPPLAPTEVPAAPEPKPHSPVRVPSRRAARAYSAPAPLPVPTSVPTLVEVASAAGRRTPPEVAEQAPLVLPPDLAAAHRDESVGMVVVIGPDGSLKSARVISPVCPECDRAALEAVRRFRFRPATDANGNPVEGTFGLAIRVP